MKHIDLTTVQLVHSAMPSLSAHAVKVGLAIAAYMDFKDGRCYPGYDRLKADTGIMKDHTIAKALTELEACGVLTRKRRKHKPSILVRNKTCRQTAFDENQDMPPNGSRYAAKRLQDMPRNGRETKPLNKTIEQRGSCYLELLLAEIPDRELSQGEYLRYSEELSDKYAIAPEDLRLRHLAYLQAQTPIPLSPWINSPIKKDRLDRRAV